MTREKMEKFETILNSHQIEYEITCEEKNKFVISVNESEYVAAKRILLKYRERKTSGDSIHGNDEKPRSTK